MGRVGLYRTLLQAERSLRRAVQADRTRTGAALAVLEAELEARTQEMRELLEHGKRFVHAWYGDEGTSMSTPECNRLFEQLHLAFRIAAVTAPPLVPALEKPELSNAERRALLFELESYGQHQRGCFCATKAHSAGDCSCGLYATLGRLRAYLLSLDTPA